MFKADRVLVRFQCGNVDWMVAPVDELCHAEGVVTHSGDPLRRVDAYVQLALVLKNERNIGVSVTGGGVRVVPLGHVHLLGRLDRVHLVGRLLEDARQAGVQEVVGSRLAAQSGA